MPPKVPVGASAFIILFDINTSDKQAALGFLSKVLYIKQLSESKDICKLYLFNTNRGVTKIDVGQVNAETVLREIQNSVPAQNNFIDALEQGVDELKQFSGTSAVNLQLLLVTDFANCTNNNRKISSTIVDDLNESDIFLYVVGPNIRPNKVLLNEEDLVAWKNEIREHPNNFNLNEAINLVKKTKCSIISDYELGLHLYNSYKYVKGMHQWNVPLTIGSQLSLPVSTIRITKKEPPFRLHTKKNSETVRWVLEDEEDKEVNSSEIVSGVVCHGKFVNIESEAMFKSENPRSFSLLGFTDQINVPEYYFQSDATYMVVPDQNETEERTQLFCLLVDELANKKLYGLARRVYNNNDEPKFVALIPKPDMKVKCFLLFELPYADDVAYGYEEQDVKSALKVVKDEDIYNFLSSIDISSIKTKVPPGLGPRLLLDPMCLDIVKKVEEKLFARQVEFIKKELITSQEEGKLFEKFFDTWPKREIIKVQENDENNDDVDDNLDDFTFDD